MHVREQIAARIDGLLAAIADFNSVSGPRSRDIPEERLPAATVFAVRETSTADHTEMSPGISAFRRQAEIVVVIHLNDQSPRTLFNALCVPVERAVLGDPRQGGLARDTTLSGTDFAIDPQTARPLGFGFVRFTVTYATLDPETPL